MKRFLFSAIMALSPCLLFAQSDGPMAEDFYTEIKGVPSVAKINDHLSVMLINTANDSFDIVGVNENMQTVWHLTVDGYGVSVGKFKNKVVAVAATEHSTMKGNGNTYKALVIDPAKGNKLAEKVIYEDANEYVEVPVPVIGDNYFKMAMRESGVTRAIHVGIPGFAFLSINHLTKEFNTTQKLQILDLNEKLDVLSSTNAPVTGRFINVTCNKNGDAFVSWLNGPDVEVYKYPAGKTSPTSKLDADVALEPNDDMDLGDLILFRFSPVNPDILFYTLAYKNSDKDTEMILGKMDFAKGTKQASTKAFLKDDMKALQKGFVPLDKKLKDAELGNPKYFEVKSLQVNDNTEIVTLQSFDTYSGAYGSNVGGRAILINAFDANLQPKFQQILPASYYYAVTPATMHIHEAYKMDKDKLYMLANLHKSGYDHVGLYGVLNLTSGQWDKMETVKDKGIKGYIQGENVAWLNGYFLVPYIKVGGMMTPKYTLELQQNQY